MDKLVKNIISFSLRHKMFTFFMTAGLGVIGIFCFLNTPIVAFPDFTNTQIRIITRWPGRSAQEVERFVTIPVEITMNSVQRKINLRSQSMFGLRSEEHTSELQSPYDLVCRLLLEKKKSIQNRIQTK